MSGRLQRIPRISSRAWFKDVLDSGNRSVGVCELKSPLLPLCKLNVQFRDSVVYFIVISVAELTVLLMWLMSGGAGVCRYFHSFLLRLMGLPGYQESTNNVRGCDTPHHVLPHDAKPSRVL